MALTADIGERFELVPMDTRCGNISIGLYRQLHDMRGEFVVHTYSRREGARQRVEFVARAMVTLGGMQLNSDDPIRLWFPCHAEHRMAVRRVFLEACKLDPANEFAPRPLAILDKKSGRTITVTSLGEGVYQVTADGEEEGKTSRVTAVAAGLTKLGEMTSVEQRPDRISFSCGKAHNAMIGLLLIRALNVRAVLREQEMMAFRGVLSAPSAQQE